MVKRIKWHLILLILTACNPSAPELLTLVQRDGNSHIDPADLTPCKHAVEDKYLALVSAGVPPSDMKMLVGDTYDERQHVVLRVQWYGSFYYLDNLAADVRETDPGLAVAYQFSPDSPEWTEILRK